MVISFKESLLKKETKLSIKIKLNEYKKALRNNMFSSEWIKNCLIDKNFIDYNLDKLSLKEISLFNRNINKNKNEFLVECRNYYKENAIPDFLKIYADDNCINDFFESYADELSNQTFKNANYAKLLISEMLISTNKDDYFEITSKDYDCFLPINKFKITNKKEEFELNINFENKKINILNSKNKEFNEFFENRNKDKSLINLFVSFEHIKNIDEVKKNMLFLKCAFLENEKLSIRPFKNNIQVKCRKNEVVSDDKNAFSIFDNKFQIFDFIRK